MPSMLRTVRFLTSIRGLGSTGSGRSILSVTAWPTIMLVISCAFVVFGGHVADELTVAEYRHAVGKRLDLVHLVRDDDDGLARVAHVAQHGEELVRLLRGQHGGRLVKNEDVRPR